MPGSSLFSCVACPTRHKSSFHDIPDEVLAELSKTKVINVYKKGQTIFYEGNRPYGVYCLNKGKVKLFKHAPEGKSFIVRLIKPGDLLGYRAFFTNELYTSTAEVIEDATICFLDREKFFDVLKKYPPFTLQLLALMGQDLKCAEEQSRNLAYKSSQERIVELLLGMRETFGIEQEDGSTKLDVSLSREDMANMLGTTTETAVRLLTWLKEKGLIKIKQKTIYLEDINSLGALITDY